MGSDDPDAELDALTRALRDERRAEAEAYEQLAAIDLLRVRTLTDVATMLLHRGDRVAVSFAQRAFAGVVAHVAGDLLSLRRPAGEVDCNLAAPLVLHVVEPGEQGLPSARQPESFWARVLQHEGASRVVLGVRLPPGELRGTLVAVARDHVVIDADGQRAFVSRAGLDYVLRDSA